jgi:predicted site-specific integrase-resolvase
MDPRKVLVTAEEGAVWLHRLGVRRISAATVRQWARRGHIATHRQGWKRYDLRELQEHARNRGLLDK